MFKFLNYEDYKSRYPDHIEKLKEIINRNENMVNHEWSRKNYIEKHIILAYEEFLQIILEGVNKIFLKSVSNIVETLDEEVKSLLNERLKNEGLITEETQFSNSLLFASMLFLSTRAAFIAGSVIATDLFAIAATSVWVPVVGWILSGITITAGLIVCFSDWVGIWKKKNTREDIYEGLFNSFYKSKGKLINCFRDEFSKFCDEIFNKLTQMKKDSSDTKNMLSMINKNKPKKIKSTDFGFNSDEFLNNIGNEYIRNYLNLSLEYKKE